MKKILTLLVLVMFAGSAFAATSLTNFQTKVNNGLNSVSQKEQALNNKIDAAQKARADQKAAAAKQQAEQKAAIEKAKKDAQAQHNATKKAVDNEVGFWRNLFKK